MMKKLFIFAGLVFAFASSAMALTRTAVTVSDGSLQPGTAAGFNVSSGTVTNFTAAASTITTLTSTSFSATASTITTLNSTTGNFTTLGVGTMTATTITSSSVTVTGSFSARGTTTNDSAGAGYIGEYVQSTVTFTNFPVTTQQGDLTSISLTAGDWDVTFLLIATINGATITSVDFGISTTSGNSTTGLVLGVNRLGILAPTAAANASGAIPAYRIQLTGPTTIYAKYSATYSAGAPQATGRLSARRAR